MPAADVFVVASSTIALATSGYLLAKTSGRHPSLPQTTKFTELPGKMQAIIVLDLISFLSLTVASNYASPPYTHLENATILAIAVMNLKSMNARKKSDTPRIVFVLSLLAVGVYLSLRVSSAARHF